MRSMGIFKKQDAWCVFTTTDGKLHMACVHCGGRDYTRASTCDVIRTKLVGWSILDILQ